MHNVPPLLAVDYVGPMVSAAIFVLVMSLIKEPTRRTFNAIFVAGASGVYLSGGFGLWELLYPAIAALNPNEPQTRAAIYNRARHIISDRLADSDNTRLSKELLSLEDAIQRIESEFLRNDVAKRGFFPPRRRFVKGSTARVDRQSFSWRRGRA